MPKASCIPPRSSSQIPTVVGDYWRRNPKANVESLPLWDRELVGAKRSNDRKRRLSQLSKWGVARAGGSRIPTVGEALRADPTGGSREPVGPSLSILKHLHREGGDWWTDWTPEARREYTPYERKCAETLARNVERMALVNGLEHIGFLTLTFPDHVTEPKEAQRRWRSFRAHVVAERYGECIKVFERCKSGRIHYHLLIVHPEDIRTGCDFGEFGKRLYSSAPEALRSEWRFLREALPKYGLGRHELLPVKSTAEGIARYTGKYLSKGREAAAAINDKHVRRVEYIQGARRQSMRWSWNTPGAWLCRMKLKRWAEIQGLDSMEEITRVCGSTWSRHLKEIMEGTIAAPDFFPTSLHKQLWAQDVTEHANRDEWTDEEWTGVLTAAAELPIQVGEVEYGSRSDL